MPPYRRSPSVSLAARREATELNALFAGALQRRSALEEGWRVRTLAGAPVACCYLVLAGRWASCFQPRRNLLQAAPPVGNWNTAPPRAVRQHKVARVRRRSAGELEFGTTGHWTLSFRPFYIVTRLGQTRSPDTALGFHYIHA